MAWQIKALTTKPGHLSSIPGTHMVGDKQLQQLSSDLHVGAMAPHPPPTHTQIYLKKFF